ncbi:MAG: DUF6152 family protein [Gammaproteobacteria bacterium]|nr:DUF6152 family protein [Gammaproteobacteria bacterium]MCZ6497124.1 DUF6152 family protein [Gammaproteobacteria bacterium]MCZ6585189.1 DUF6152 family protein [Gammaproteobacteria bacterium]
MRLRKCTVYAVTAVALILVNPLNAHHSQRPFYDYSQWVEIEGTVNRFNFGNPHPVLYLQVTEPDGETVEWKLLFPPASVLMRRGWTAEQFVPGDIVTARGHPSRRSGTHGMARLTITRSDGTVAFGGGGGASSEE